MDKESINQMELHGLLELETRGVSQELFEHAIERTWSLLFGDLRALLSSDSIDVDAFEDLATTAWHMDAAR